MSKVRLAIIYYSTYGTNHAMAEVAAQAAREAGAEVRLLKVRETAPESVVASTQAWPRMPNAPHRCPWRRPPTWNGPTWI